MKKFLAVFLALCIKRRSDFSQWVKKIIGGGYLHIFDSLYRRNRVYMVWNLYRWSDAFFCNRLRRRYLPQ